MTPKERVAMQQALEALIVAEEFVDRHSEDWYISGQQDLKLIREAITALREALDYSGEANEMVAEQAEQEPVAYLRMGSDQRFVVTKAAEELVADTFHQLYAAPVRTKDYNPDVIFNDDGTFSLTLPDGDELRIIPPQQEPTAEVTEDGYAWGKDGILPAGSLLYAAPVRTKDLTDDEIENAWLSELDWLSGCRAVIAADRKLNKQTKENQE